MPSAASSRRGPQHLCDTLNYLSKENYMRLQQKILACVLRDGSIGVAPWKRITRDHTTRTPTKYEGASSLSFPWALYVVTYPFINALFP